MPLIDLIDEEYKVPKRKLPDDEVDERARKHMEAELREAELAGRRDEAEQWDELADNGQSLHQ